MSDKLDLPVNGSGRPNSIIIRGLHFLMEKDGQDLLLWKSIATAVREALGTQLTSFSVTSNNNRKLDFVFVPGDIDGAFPALQVTERGLMDSTKEGKNVKGNKVIWRMPLVLPEETSHGLTPAMLDQLYPIDSVDAALIREVFSTGLVARTRVAIVFQKPSKSALLTNC